MWRAANRADPPCSEGNSYEKDSLLEEDKLEADYDEEVLVMRGHVCTLILMLILVYNYIWH